MRLMVFFDLPVVTAEDRRAYNKFRKFLIHEGFLMMQFSVYSKLVLNLTAADFLKGRIKKNLPKEGLIQVMVITENQFAGIENFIGASKENAISSTDRLIVL